MGCAIRASMACGPAHHLVLIDRAIAVQNGVFGDIRCASTETTPLRFPAEEKDHIVMHRARKKAARCGAASYAETNREKSGGGGGLLLDDVALEATGLERQLVVAGLDQPVVETTIMFDRTQTMGRHAQLEAGFQRFGDQRNILQIGQEHPLGLVIGVGNIVTHLATLAGQLANARHSQSTL